MPLTRSRTATLGAAGGAALIALLLLSRAIPSEGYAGLAAVSLLVGAVAAAYVAWHIDPAWMLTGAVVLSCFNGNWGEFGLPAMVAPDRVLLLGAIVGIALHAPPARSRPAFSARGVHLLLAVTLAWVVGSGVAAGTLPGGGDPLFELLDRYAVPFAVFALAPLAFDTRRRRMVLLAALVAFAAYVGLVTLLQTVGLHQLVFPRFIVSDGVGYHAARARGPFLEASVNGVGLYVGMVMCLVASATWRAPWARWTARGVAVLCAAGLLFSLTRSVWAAAIVASVVTMLVARELRRHLLPAIAVATVGVVALFALLPGLDAAAGERRQAKRSVWERQNVNAAALAMAAERPLVGFGLGTFNAANSDHFPLLDDIPQVAERRLAVHNVFLAVVTELGLIGLALFVASLLAVVAGGLSLRGPPELRAWQLALLAIAVFWFVVANFVPLGQVLPSMIVWFVAGVTYAAAAGGSPGRQDDVAINDERRSS
jgi:O-antigen ligase